LAVRGGEWISKRGGKVGGWGWPGKKGTVCKSSLKPTLVFHSAIEGKKKRGAEVGSHSWARASFLVCGRGPSFPSFTMRREQKKEGGGQTPGIGKKHATAFAKRRDNFAVLLPWDRGEGKERRHIDVHGEG